MRLNYQKEKREMIDGLKNFPWDSKRATGDYLAQTYYYVRHSEKFLALAAGLMNEEDRKYQRRFLQHLSEENAHDLMVKKDLESLGYSLDDFPERIETKMFWETQYFKIEHEDPMILMGYILLLEDIASEVCGLLAEKICQHHTKKASTFLRVHGEEDPHHVAEALGVIDSLAEARQRLVYSNLIQSQKAYVQMIQAIIANEIEDISTMAA
jgi:thiaminase